MKPIIYIIISFSLFYAHIHSKIVGLVAVKNEQAIIKQCLMGLALYTDAIVVLDDASSDATVEIVKSLQEKCNIETIIQKNVWHRDEPGDKNKLLEAGRQIKGTHFIVIDADEMLTANFLDNNFLRNQILHLKPGDCIELNWIALWRSVNVYRYDNSVWTNNYGRFIFCDDKKANYSSDFIHCSRIPNNLKGATYRVCGYKYGLLHFQFVNWDNLLLKHVWYRFLEKIRKPQKPISEINRLYSLAIDERGLGLKKSPEEWFKNYTFFDAKVYSTLDNWRKTQVLGWLEDYGVAYFEGLNREGFILS